MQIIAECAKAVATNLHSRRILDEFARDRNCATLQLSYILLACRIKLMQRLDFVTVKFDTQWSLRGGEYIDDCATHRKCTSFFRERRSCVSNFDQPSKQIVAITMIRESELNAILQDCFSRDQNLQ